MMWFSGVRSSWLMVARNKLLARLATSAASRARAASALDSSSSRVRRWTFSSIVAYRSWSSPAIPLKARPSSPISSARPTGTREVRSPPATFRTPSVSATIGPEIDHATSRALGMTSTSTAPPIASAMFRLRATGAKASAVSIFTTMPQRIEGRYCHAATVSRPR
jgi:hypothetical protein